MHARAAASLGAVLHPGSLPHLPTRPTHPTGTTDVLGPPLLLDGPQSVIVDEVPPRGEARVTLRLLALAPGQHSLQGLVLAGERDGRAYDTLPRQDLYVLPPARQ